jgi:hypothetical protein
VPSMRSARHPLVLAQPASATATMNNVPFSM